jgi:hypothetical protein
MTPNTLAILFANPEVANCKTVDLTNIRLRHCGKQTEFFMLQLDVKDLEKYFNSSLFSLFKRRRKSNTTIKSRTSRPNHAIAMLVPGPYSIAKGDCLLISWQGNFLIMMYNSSSQAFKFAASQIQISKVSLMLIRKLSNVSRALLMSSLLCVSPYGAFAQERKQPADPVQAPTQTGAAKKSKAGADSCDGALDIVPGKAATFTRKRRPTKPEAKPEAKPETKAEAKPESKSQ